jgi:hypothetical protein
MTLIHLILLYVSFRIKQYASDFLLQSYWMAHTKGRPGKEGYKALFYHTIIHAIGTTLIALVFAPALWWLGVLDFAVHSMVDRIKGILTWERQWSPKDTIFWWTFGLDQEAHNFSHLAYIIIIVAHMGGINA